MITNQERQLRYFRRQRDYYSKKYEALNNLLQDSYKIDEIAAIIQKFTGIDVSIRKSKETFTIKRAKQMFWRYGRMNNIRHQDLTNYTQNKNRSTVVQSTKYHSKKCENDFDTRIYWIDFLKFAESNKKEIFKQRLNDKK